MNKPDEMDTVRVTLTSDGPGPPAHIRLKRWLKHALRTWGLRVVSYEVCEPVEATRNDPVVESDR